MYTALCNQIYTLTHAIRLRDGVSDCISSRQQKVNSCNKLQAATKKKLAKEPKNVWRPTKVKKFQPQDNNGKLTDQHRMRRANQQINQPCTLILPLIQKFASNQFHCAAECCSH